MVTLIVCTVLAMVVVAMMQNTTLDRSSSRSMANQYRAQLAAEAGLSEVMANIGDKTRSDDFIVLKSDAEASGATFPVFYLGVPRTDSSSLDYTPLFSGGASQTEVEAGRMPDAQNVFVEGAVVSESLQVPPHVTADGAAPVQTAWVDLKDPSGRTTSRYSYWVEDLGGYLDADRAGSQPFVRSDGRSPEELGIFTLFRPLENDNSSAASGSPDSMLLEARSRKPESLSSLFFTPATLGFIGLGDGMAEDGSYDETADAQRFFATGLVYAPELDVVPRGLGYANAGEPKKDLNELVARGGDGAVAEIADWISANLPEFGERNPEFPASQNYAKTLAANIIDYADSDNDATVGPDYRGVDSYPFLTQIYLQVTWLNNQDGEDQPFFKSGGTWRVKIRADYHLQVWNPSNQPVERGTLTLDLSPSAGNPGERMAIFFDGSEIVPLYPFPNNPGFNISVALEPNEYSAYSIGPIEYEIDTGYNADEPPPDSEPWIATSGFGQFEERKEHGYKILWNGNLVDQPGAVLHGSTDIALRKEGKLDKSPANSGEGPEWRGALPGLRQGNPQDDSIFSDPQCKPLLGDPRGSFYSSGVLDAQLYVQNASWWGRHWVSPNSTSGVRDWFVAEARLNSWPDGAHADQSDRAVSLADVTPVGNSPAAQRAKATTVPSALRGRAAPVQSDKAPARISNAGRYSSITELGNIYDPLQWRPTWDEGNETIESVDRKWLELGDDMVADSDYVVPTTLRIGRAEFGALDRPGRRAYQLLDLFTVGDTVATEGRININTASRDVLRTLGAGLALSADPRIEPPSLRGDSKLFGPFEEKQADLLADAIIQSRPFVTASQLSNIKITKDGEETGFFGNLEMWADNGPTRWTDAAAEEYFARLFGLVTVRSRNFRVYVTGESLDASGNVTARSNWVYQIASVPVRAEDGTITGQNVFVTSSKSL